MCHRCNGTRGGDDDSRPLDTHRGLTTRHCRFSGPGQNARQILELAAAFGLTALTGLERETRGKSAGLRTQTMVGTSAALILLFDKYGFGDVVSTEAVIVDPSRVAAQIDSGIGILGAGVIITRRGAVIGLTTAPTRVTRRSRQMSVAWAPACRRYCRPAARRRPGPPRRRRPPQSTASGPAAPM